MERNNEIENWYSKEDPWSYKTNPSDLARKSEIIHSILSLHSGEFLFEHALDIGCGEGWITKDLPAKNIDGIELSNNATSIERFPNNVRRVSIPEGKYDLVIATGVLYKHYDYEQFLKWINESSSKIVLTCNIKEWEVEHKPFGKLLFESEFKYREFIQSLKVYDVSLS